MLAYLWVALGSALGGVARFGLGLLAGRLWGDSFPWGTIGINILGSFIIGFFGALTTPEGPIPASQSLRIFVMVGICGGFTTFSSFSLQTVSLARDGSWLGAMANVLLSVTLCLLAVTLGHYSAARIGVLHTEAAAMSHTILAILDRPQTAHPVLAAAAFAAQRMGSARIEALHLRHDALEGFMPTEEVMTRQREQEIAGAAARKSDDMRALFDAWRRQSGMGDWREVVGEATRIVAAEAAGADLVVIGQAADHDRGGGGQALRVALFEAKRATLLVPETMTRSLGRNVAIAWKPGVSIERAIRAAMPLLRRAEQVAILVETEGGGAEAETSGLLQRLQQADVQTSVLRFQARGRTIGDALIDEANRAGADLLVMGAYSHGRLTALILGGATREVLASANLPVFLHH